MRTLIITAALSLAITTQTNALTFKKGEVLGADGEVYHGASPDQMERLIEQAKESGDVSGVTGTNVFVVVGEDVTFEQVNTVNKFSAETGISVEEILADGDIAGIDPDIMKQIEAMSAETGISIDNLVAVNSVIEAMPEGQANQFIEDLGDLVDSGMAEQVDAFLDDLRDIEGAMDAITEFDSYESCVAGGGGATCDAIEEAMNENDV
jgi:hypothetical protein